MLGSGSLLVTRKLTQVQIASSPQIPHKSKVCPSTLSHFGCQKNYLALLNCIANNRDLPIRTKQELKQWSHHTQHWGLEQGIRRSGGKTWRKKPHLKWTVRRARKLRNYMTYQKWDSVFWQSPCITLQHKGSRALHQEMLHPTTLHPKLDNIQNFRVEFLLKNNSFK